MSARRCVVCLLVALALSGCASGHWFGYPRAFYVAGPELAHNGQKICARPGDHASVAAAIFPIWRTGRGFDVVAAGVHSSCLDGPDLPSMDIAPAAGVYVDTETLFR